MVPQAALFDYPTLLMNPVKVVNTGWGGSILDCHQRPIDSNRHYFTLCVRSAFRALTPVFGWFGKFLE
jgi:hypothetical protein